MRTLLRNLADEFRNGLIGLTRPRKQLVSVLLDSSGFATCALISAWFVYGLSLSWSALATIAVVAALFSVPLVWLQGLYQSVVRYIGFDLFLVALKTAFAASAIVSLSLYFINSVPFSIRWGGAYFSMALIFICSSRFIGRNYLSRSGAMHDREPVIVYGAGAAGAGLVTGLLNGNDFIPVAMVDDDVSLFGKHVRGLVVHAPSTIPKLIRQTGATKVLMAMPSATRQKRRQILERLTEYPVHVQTMPELSDLVSGKAKYDDITDVDVEDLLGRNSVPPDVDLLKASITGKSVMVTGAGGSIGSELCRQIVNLKPRTLILFELSEIALYNIESEIRERMVQFNVDCEVIGLLGSVHHEKRVAEVLQSFRVKTVYHAAAYKHVPVVEHNLLEGVHNNIFGTLHTARAAAASGVENFVLISTDKAVSPTNVMGATKRVAELVLQALNDRFDNICFCMVRFGNVLESSGSVVPLFRRQIRSGGPVTVTHPEIIRYFMTIPEAAQLVIQAGAMAKGGDVFVLNMGEPVKIKDLAARMINLMGLTIRDEKNPDGDIEILYTGLRPAEKLYEELLIGSNVSGTRHPRIMRAQEDYLDFETLDAAVTELRIASEELDRERARSVLLKSVHGYKPTAGIEDLVWVRRNGKKDKVQADTVVNFKPRSAG